MRKRTSRSDCLGSLRPSERNGAEAEVRAAPASSEVDAKVKWSSCKADESAVVRGRNSTEAVRTIWRPAPA